MKIYLVGGAVRDKLLNLPVKERDYVVVGASIKDMLTLGYQQVGKEFPVFLHPDTREEYALARMERKTRPGYTGFEFDTSPTVTLEEDLLRRDLTINAMAEDKNGHLIDPFNGQEDLKNKQLRHVSPAFAEDPVRILRVARFIARYQHIGFHIADETLQLMKDMVTSGEVDALVPERVWKELERALGEKNPAAFFETLEACGAAQVLMPELSMEKLDLLKAAANSSDDTTIRFAVLFYALPEASIKNISNRFRIPNSYRELTLLTARHAEKLISLVASSKIADIHADDLLSLFYAVDIFRREQRFTDFLTICSIIAQQKDISFPSNWVLTAARHIKDINVQQLIQQGFKDREIADALRKERKTILTEWIKQH